MQNTVKLKEYDVFLSHTLFKWSKPSTWICPVIRYVTGSYWNHAGIFVRVKGVLMVLEATSLGFNFTKRASVFQSEENIVRHYAVLRDKNSSENSPDVDFMLPSLIGNNYDFKSLLFRHLEYKFTGKWKEENKQFADLEKESLTCSEGVAALFMKYFPQWWKITPQDLSMSKEFETVYITAF